MNFNELKDMILKDFNDPGHKCYQNLNCIWGSYSRKKRLKEDIINATKFVDDNFHATKKVPTPPMSLRLYCIINDIDSGDKYPKCPTCNKPKNFISITEGFGLSCGNPNCFQKLDEVNEKRQKTIIKNFGSLKAGYHDTSIKTIQEKYGVDNVSKLDWVKQKKIETSIENWGTDYPWQSEEGKRLQKESVYRKYGVYNISQLDEVKAKKIITSIKNWEIDNPSKHPEVRGRILKSSGNEYVTKSGKIVLYDGFENIVLDYLYDIYNEDKVIPQPNIGIKYEVSGKEKVWFPDFLILNKPQELIEFKTVFEIDDVEQQILSSKLLNYDSYIIFQKGKELTRLDILDDGTWFITGLTSSESELNRICNWLIKNERKVIFNDERRSLLYDN